MKKYLNFCIVGLLISLVEMIVSHNFIIKSKHIWDNLSIVINFSAYLIAFFISFFIFFLSCRNKKIEVHVVIRYLPYILIFLYYVLLAMPSYLKFNLLNILLFPVFIAASK